MKPGEKGFTLLELLVSVAITGLITVAAGSAMFQIFRGTGSNNDYMTAVRQVQNAGFWISRDAQRADSVNTTANETAFLTIRWTEWVAPNNPVYHSANYTFENLGGGIGTLKRIHKSSSVGTSDQTLIAQYIYYNLADSANTSKASYQSPVLTVQLTALCDKARETREYKIKRRPNS